MKLAAAARLLIQFEALSNGFIFAPLMMFFPAALLASWVPEGTPIDPLAAEIFRGFGAMTMTFAGYMLWKALEARGEIESLVLRTFLFCDFLYVGSFHYWCWSNGFWFPGCVFNVVYGWLLAAGRVLILHSKGGLWSAEAAAASKTI